MFNVGNINLFPLIAVNAKGTIPLLPEVALSVPVAAETPPVPTAPVVPEPVVAATSLLTPVVAEPEAVAPVVASLPVAEAVVPVETPERFFPLPFTGSGLRAAYTAISESEVFFCAAIVASYRAITASGVQKLA